MKFNRAVAVSLVTAASLAAGLTLARAQATAPPVLKKDVPYVPTPPEVVQRMLDLGGVKSGDVLYDLGCGDGRIVIAAVKRPGVKGVCVDLDPERNADSRRNAEAAGVTD